MKGNWYLDNGNNSDRMWTKWLETECQKSSRNQHHHRQQLGKVKRFQKLLSTVFCCAKSTQSDYKLISMHSFQFQPSGFEKVFFLNCRSIRIVSCMCVNVSPPLLPDLRLRIVCYCMASKAWSVNREFFAFIFVCVWTLNGNSCAVRNRRRPAVNVQSASRILVGFVNFCVA